MAKGFVRKFVKIQGNLHELWLITDIEVSQEYNQLKDGFDYILTLIRGRAVNKEQIEKRYIFHTQEDRDAVRDEIMKGLQSDLNVSFLGEDED